MKKDYQQLESMKMVINIPKIKIGYSQLNKWKMVISNQKRMKDVGTNN